MLMLSPKSDDKPIRRVLHFPDFRKGGFIMSTISSMTRDTYTMYKMAQGATQSTTAAQKQLVKQRKIPAKPLRKAKAILQLQPTSANSAT